MDRMTLPASTQQLNEAQAFVDRCAGVVGFTAKELWALHLVVEELFVNIALNAYGPQGGEVALECEAADGEFTLTLVDGGKPFDPLAQKPPDLDTPLEGRGEGGLGIMLARRYSSEMRYERLDGQNRLTIVKRPGGGS